jgi:hypothetical protein
VADCATFPSATFAKPSARAGVSRIRRRPPATATQTLETLRNTPDNLLAHARRPPHSAPHGPSPNPARGGAKRRDIRRAPPCRGARRLRSPTTAAPARRIAPPFVPYSSTVFKSALEGHSALRQNST